MPAGGLLDSGCLPVLEMTARFAARRHELLAHHIANADTPDFRPLDVSPADFQRLLGLVPRTPSRNILFHDRNNRDLERTMQALAENTGAFRVSIDLLRSRYQAIHAAIGERVA
jgi:flagellar basal-body rod protein FlgB